MTSLFHALRRAGYGKDNQGVVLIDDGKAYRHWVEDETVFFEVTHGSDAAFADQEVKFDDNGSSTAVDINNRSREVRILVMVPFNGYLQMLDLIHPPT